MNMIDGGAKEEKQRAGGFWTVKDQQSHNRQDSSQVKFISKVHLKHELTKVLYKT